MKECVVFVHYVAGGPLPYFFPLKVVLVSSFTYNALFSNQPGPHRKHAHLSGLSSSIPSTTELFLILLQGRFTSPSFILLCIVHSSTTRPVTSMCLVTCMTFSSSLKIVFYLFLCPALYEYIRSLQLQNFSCIEYSYSSFKNQLKHPFLCNAFVNTPLPQSLSLSFCVLL